MIFISVYTLVLVRSGFLIKRNKSVKALYLFAFSISVSSGFAFLLSGSVNMYVFVNWPLKMIFYALGLQWISYVKMCRNEASTKFLLDVFFVFLFMSAMIGILQVAEFSGVIPNLRINRFLSSLYPYRGELTGATLSKTQGYLLKMGSVGRATGTFDGHPILFGDFLAVGGVLVLPLIEGWKRLLGYVPVVFALLLTLSRGSILAYCVGLLMYFFMCIARSAAINPRKIVAKTKKLFLALLILILLLNYTPLGESIYWRLRTTSESILGTGTSEARFDDRWPSAIREVNDYGFMGWVLGIPSGYTGSTDSQYLWFLVNLGLVGVGLLLFFHLALIVEGLRYSRRHANTSLVLMKFGMSFVSSLVTLLVLYVFHPALQGDRLLSTVLLFAIVMSL